MEDYIANISGVTYLGHLAKAEEKPVPFQLETRMLDGSVSVQTLGNPVIEVEVEYYCPRLTRRLLQDCASTGGQLVVYFEDRAWTGVISSGSFKSEVYMRDMLDKVTFTLLTLEEAER